MVHPCILPLGFYGGRGASFKSQVPHKKNRATFVRPLCNSDCVVPLDKSTCRSNVEVARRWQEKLYLARASMMTLTLRACSKQFRAPVQQQRQPARNTHTMPLLIHSSTSGRCFGSYCFTCQVALEIRMARMANNHVPSTYQKYD